MLVIRHNSAYGNVPSLFSLYKIGLDAPGYARPSIPFLAFRLWALRDGLASQTNIKGAR